MKGSVSLATGGVFVGAPRRKTVLGERQDGQDGDEAGLRLGHVSSCTHVWSLSCACRREMSPNPAQLRQLSGTRAGASR
jgi:hypothetical protein